MGIWRPENCVLTQLGLEYHAKVEAGAPFRLTRALAGRGRVPASQLRQQTEVSMPVKDMARLGVSVSGNRATIPVVLSNAGLTVGFQLNQVGVYAEDPDLGEILYLIAQADTADAVPSGGESGRFSLEMSFHVVFDTDLAVNVHIDPDLGVSEEELQAAIEEIHIWVQDRFIPIPEKGAPGGVATLNLEEDQYAGIAQVPEWQLRKATRTKYGITKRKSFIEDSSIDVLGRLDDIMSIETFLETGLFTAKKTGRHKIILIGGGASGKNASGTAVGGGNSQVSSLVVDSETAVANWTGRTLPADSSCISSCWSPKLRMYCATTSNGYVLTSPDGITWTKRQLSGWGNSWYVCWSPELEIFCAVGPGGRASVWSPDGITWTEGYTVSNNNAAAICWSSQLRKFCATTDMGEACVSSDGRTWTSVKISGTTSITQATRGICWAPEMNMFCATRPGRYFYTSPDGLTWTQRDIIDGSSYYRSICYSSELGRFCAVGYGMDYNVDGGGAQTYATDSVIVSDNGIVWSKYHLPAVAKWRSVIWSPELRLFVAVASGEGTNTGAGTSGSGLMATSPDGINWTLRQMPSVGVWMSLCWSPEKKQILAIGTNVAASSSPYTSTGQLLLTARGAAGLNGFPPGGDGVIVIGTATSPPQGGEGYTMGKASSRALWGGSSGYGAGGTGGTDAGSHSGGSGECRVGTFDMLKGEETTVSIGIGGNAGSTAGSMRGQPGACFIFWDDEE